MAKKKPTSRKSPPAPGATAPASDVEEIDRRLLDLLAKRVEATSSSPLEPGSAVGWAVKHNPGPLSDQSVRAIFREIESGCRQLSLPQRVAYLGPEHTFSHIAAIERFGNSAELVPLGSIAAVFEEVEQGTSAYGVVPLENSTDGRVSDTLECFAHSPLRIQGELPLRIHHCLLGSGPRAKIRQVASKPQALSQCRNWLAKHLPQAEVIAVASTADAARDAAKNPTVAAIASAQAAAEYGLEVLVRNIEDNRDNVTRFAVIAPEPAERTGNDKTSLMLEIAHEPGALADAMAIFKRARLNLTWIESFPVSGSRGRYLFFIELVGHSTDLRVRRAIASLEKKARRLVVLGSYAHGEAIG